MGSGSIERKRQRKGHTNHMPSFDGTDSHTPNFMKAKADLMEETRLATKADRQHSLAVAAEKIEKKLPKTAESLGHLGAGQPYGGE